MAASRTLMSRISPLLAAARSSSSVFIHRFRPLIAGADALLLRRSFTLPASLCSFSTRPTTSSLNDPSPNWSNRPPKETILLDGCDFEHWLVVMDPPEVNWTREEIIQYYIETLAKVVGSEQEARMKLYSVSTKHYFAFGALISEELSVKLKSQPRVRWVLPDSYLDVRNKDYGGEPVIDGVVAPYDPKYHEEWVRNNARANERSRRNDRPRNYDRSRNFERRRENMQMRDAPPMQSQGFQGGNPALPQNAPPPPTPNRDFNSVPNNAAPPSQSPPNAGYQNQMPNPGYQPSPQAYQNAPPPPTPNRDFNSVPNNAAPPSQSPPNAGYQNQMPNPGYQPSPQAYQGQNAPPAYQGQGYQGGNANYQGGSPGYQGGNPGYQGGNPGYQGGPPPYQGGGPAYQGGPPYPGGNNYQAGSPQGYQAGNSPSYQPGPNAGGNPTSYPAANPSFSARDVPGRDNQ